MDATGLECSSRRKLKSCSQTACGRELTQTPSEMTPSPRQQRPSQGTSLRVRALGCSTARRLPGAAEGSFPLCSTKFHPPLCQILQCGGFGFCGFGFCGFFLSSLPSLTFVRAFQRKAEGAGLQSYEKNPENKESSRSETRKPSNGLRIKEIL